MGITLTFSSLAKHILLLLSQLSLCRILSRAFLVSAILYSAHSRAIDFSWLDFNDTEAETIDVPPDSAQDLRYGVVLYHFYQQSYFDALTELMVGQLKEDIVYHKEGAELLRGGMSLSYGLDRQAEPIFQRLLDKNRMGSEKDLAWFYLGKLQYQRGSDTKSEKTLSRLNGNLPVSLEQESHAIKANLLLQQGKFVRAEQEISALPIESVWQPYYYYNLGVMQTTSGQWQQGIESFSRIKNLSAESEELKNLRDKAFTAAGFSNLVNEKYPQAIESFKQVRLNSPMVHKALLGYGWAEAQSGDFDAALSPWQKLSQLSLLNASVQESLLAIPYAYEKLNAAGSALAFYESSVVNLNAELKRLNKAINKFEGDAIDELFTINNGFSDNWFVVDDILSSSVGSASNNNLYLSHLISQYDFQKALKNYRDLANLSRNLTQAKQRLLIMDGVKRDQLAAWDKVFDESKYRKFQNRYQALLSARDALNIDIEQAIKEGDGFRLADEKSRDLWNLVQDAEKSLESLYQNDKDISEKTRKLKLLRGLLVWKNNEDFYQRVWDAKKQQKDLNEVLNKTESGMKSLSLAIEGYGKSNFDQRMLAVGQRLSASEENVKILLNTSEKNLRVLAIDELSLQRLRLRAYIGQAKLSIARLYDTGSVDGNNEN